MVDNNRTLNAIDAELMTFCGLIDKAEAEHKTLSQIIIEGAAQETGRTYGQVLEDIDAAFSHNMRALEIGATTGESSLLGKCASQLIGGDSNAKLFADPFLNKAVIYTLAAQIGNHSIGLEPCAGTGDSCPYTGMYRALIEEYGKEKAVAAAAVMLRLGTIFRVGKITTGCNMEGLGAGAAAGAAALTELWGGTPSQAGKAVVLAISPTIAVPCTPRVLVPGLCATHIGGAVVLAVLAARLVLLTDIPVNVPADVMLALAADVHPASAQRIVPFLIHYLQPYFKTNEAVERYVSDEIKAEEKTEREASVCKAREKVAAMLGQANPITKPFGEAVVGGSSQAVGSPTNAARIAHYLAKGEIRSVKIELYPELFARRGINIPGILMGAVFGAPTSDVEMYQTVMEKMIEKKIEVEIVRENTPQLQRVTIVTDQGTVMVDTLNRGGGRLKIRDARPGLEAARAAARELGIVEAD